MALDWLFFLRPPTFLLHLLLLSLTAASSVGADESDALLRLKKSFTNATALISWAPGGSPPCKGKLHWHGVLCSNDMVTGIRLENLGLSGTIDVDALIEIAGLRTLSLGHNSFNGTIPGVNRLSYLKAVYLNGNQFSGEIPPDFFGKMVALKKLWLSDNKFSGLVPPSIGQISNLIELQLQDNQFSGAFPNIQLAKLAKFDVSNNNLTGEIPSGLAKFNATSFAGNPGLCGGITGKKCDVPPQKDGGAATSSEGIQNNPNATAIGIGSNFKKTVAGIVTLGVLLFLISAVIVIKMMPRKSDEDDDGDFETLGNRGRRNSNEDEPFEVQVSLPTTRLQATAQESARKGTAGPSRQHRTSNAQGKGNVGEFVMMNDDKGVFGLPDLMKASAEILGNGGMGSSYKAVMAGGTAVVVKRIREMNAMGKDGFESEIKMLGKLRHPNVLTPLAFHYRKDEKLLIYEFVPTGSLLFLLHGDRGPTHPGLNWASRLRIVKGIARGLGYIHSELGGTNLPHGNLKSSNVLVGPDNEPRVSEYGFSSLINSSVISQVLVAYKAPEAMAAGGGHGHGHVSPKSDVFCLGILILEILTGKLPCQYTNAGAAGTDLVRWVESVVPEGREAELLDPEIAGFSNSIGQMVRLIHIGAHCAHSVPEQRLELREAIKRINDIQLEDGSSVEQGHQNQNVVDNQFPFTAS
ncbi:unnamed protein product [Linum tenue]|uniref:Protein kinase domain-containing protein n=1 Tax=Linum tenue TaxID=586396 RepID=A0AAV0KB82_9ROSI|nr:unnamed protein product [Linum tenue]